MVVHCIQYLFCINNSTFSKVMVLKVLLVESNNYVPISSFCFLTIILYVMSVKFIFCFAVSVINLTVCLCQKTGIWSIL